MKTLERICPECCGHGDTIDSGEPRFCHACEGAGWLATDVDVTDPAQIASELTHAERRMLLRRRLRGAIRWERFTAFGLVVVPDGPSPNRRYWTGFSRRVADVIREAA